MNSVLELLFALAAVFAPLALAGFLIEWRFRGRHRHHGASAPRVAPCKSSTAKADS